MKRCRCNNVEAHAIRKGNMVYMCVDCNKLVTQSEMKKKREMQDMIDKALVVLGFKEEKRAVSVVLELEEPKEQAV